MQNGLRIEVLLRVETFVNPRHIVLDGGVLISIFPTATGSESGEKFCSL